MGTVKQFTRPTPPLDDIPARLRWLAAEIEKGEASEIGVPAACMVMMAFEDGSVTFFEYGEPLLPIEKIGMLTMAAMAVGQD